MLYAAIEGLQEARMRRTRKRGKDKSRDRRAYKAKVLGMLARNLEVFFPHLKDSFMCPTCLQVLPVSKPQRISKAHIIPKSAGGGLATYSCRRCNSTFGTLQDKWFGECLRLKMRKQSVIDSRIKARSFSIDGISVNGDWRWEKGEGLQVLIDDGRNSPQTRKAITEKFRHRPWNLRLKLKFPILKQKRLIEVGCLTAAYLYWFRALGYSWALQSHLEPVRQQILNPDKLILKGRFVAYCDEVSFEPWIGAVRIGGEFALAMGVENFLAILPPVDDPDLYSRIGFDVSGKSLTDILPMSFVKSTYYGPGVAVLIDDRILVQPDLLGSLPKESSICLSYSSDTKEGQVLYPVSAEEFNQLAKLPNAFVRRIEAYKLRKRAAGLLP